MAYSDFTLAGVIRQFGLTLGEDMALFAEVKPATPSDHLRATLTENMPLALALQTEKARSELLIMPILVEVRRRLHRQVSLFSGVDFTVDAALGLYGTCDFLLSRSKEQLYVKAPVVAIVQAKNENIKAGLEQCIAEMVAAQRFNSQEDTGITTVYGIVTTGSNWRFLKLSEQTVAIDPTEFYLDGLDVILGILLFMVGEG